MSNISPIVSVTILHYNRVKELKHCLALTMRYFKKNFKKNEYEIIIVDNASTAKLPRLDSPVTLIKSKENIGMRALNIAFKKAQGKYILELDDDSYPLSGIKNAIRYLEKNPTVGILGLCIKGENNPINQTQHLSRLTGFVGCGVLMRKRVFELTGGYPPWIFIYANEHELAMHALYYGYQTRFFAYASVMHLLAKTHRTSERLAYHSAKNYTISYLIYFNGIIGFTRTFLLQLLILLKIPKDRYYFRILYFTLKGFINGMIYASKTPKKYLPKKTQVNIFLRGMRSVKI